MAAVWRLEAYAGHWLPDTDLAAVTEWMSDNRLVRCTTQHSVVVEGGRITYGRDDSDETVPGPLRVITTVTVPLRTPPPEVWHPTCTAGELTALQAVFAEHDWSSGYGGVCVTCSRAQVREDGRVWCRREDAEPWPCPPAEAAMVAAGVRHGQHGQPRLLGDCLDPVANQAAFAALNH